MFHLINFSTPLIIAIGFLRFKQLTLPCRPPISLGVRSITKEEFLSLVGPSRKDNQITVDQVSAINRVFQTPAFPDDTAVAAQHIILTQSDHRIPRRFSRMVSYGNDSQVKRLRGSMHAIRNASCLLHTDQVGGKEEKKNNQTPQKLRQGLRRALKV